MSCLVFFYLMFLLIFTNSISIFSEIFFSWSISASLSTIPDFTLRTFLDLSHYLLETTHYSVYLLEPSMNVKMWPELHGYSKFLWWPCTICYYNAAKSCESFLGCCIPLLTQLWNLCEMTISTEIFFSILSARLHISLY